MSRFRFVYLLMLPLVVTLASARAQDSGPRLEVGEPFPGIVLPSLEGGRPVSLAEFRGRKIILHVFASW